MVTVKVLITCVALILFRLDSSALETTRSGHGSSPQTYGAPLYGGNVNLAQSRSQDWSQALMLYDRGQVKNLHLFSKIAQQGMSSLPQIHH